jgi:hypothetical protein
MSMLGVPRMQTAIRSLYPPLSHTIGRHHITQFATLPHFPESTL